MSTQRPARRSGLGISRRRFLVTAGNAAGLMILPRARTAFCFSANERLRLAVVGMAGYGAWHGFAESLHLTYDPVAGMITSHAEANSKLAYAYREGWRL